MDKYIGVTRLINSYFPEFNSLEIAIKCSKGSNPKYSNRDPIDIVAEWSKIAKDGDYCHACIDAYLNKRASFLSKYQYIKEILDKLQTKYTFIEAEKKVKNEKWGVRGVVDAIFQHKKTGKLLIIDWKTNAKIDAYNKYQSGLGILDHLTDCKLIKYSLQLNFYKALLQEEYDVEDCELAIVQIQKTQTKVIPVKCMEREIGMILYEKGVL